MGQEAQMKFSEMISSRLVTESTRSIWRSMAQEYERSDGGPDAAVEWLTAEQIRFRERVDRSLGQLADQVEG